MLIRLIILTLAALLAAPTLAEAHTAGVALNGWHDGFNHPLHGWDHLVAMVAVGIWAAQHQGRASWLIPLTFLALMTVGGVVGVSGAAVPGVEIMIGASVVVFAVFVLGKVRIDPRLATSVVGLFAFFHGYAHGVEMPGAASLGTFGIGFLVATALLHAFGFVVTRIALILAMASSGAMLAKVAIAADDAGSQAPRIPEIIVYGRQDSLLHVATSATQGTVGAIQLSERPIMRTGEILETVPGVIITQHAGGGKANQYFLRGFNLDHGTDFATSIDDMPINLPSHAHGQGYSDLNGIIPELVERVNYQKGVYYAENGDFASAGAAHLESFKTLTRPIIVLEGGVDDGYGRIMSAASTGVGPGNVLAGFEVARDDGPWLKPDNYIKANGVLTYSQDIEDGGFSLTARGYHGRWNSSDQIATSVVASGLIPLYGSLNTTDGGNSQRYSLQGEWHHAGTSSRTKVSAYGFYYDLNLFSDFTYYLVDPVHGDQFEQRDKRLTTGLQAAHTMFDQWGGHDVENTIGLQFRNDNAHPGLYQTENRQRISKIDSSTGDVLPAITRQDSVVENSIGLYVENKTQWTGHFRTVAGLREDFFNFNVDNNQPLNSGTRNAVMTSPKLSLIFGPWSQTEIYLQGGLGMHSNDARGVLTHVDPVTGGAVNSDGARITPATPLVRSKGADLGIRTLAVPHLQSTLSFWWLDLDSELVFSGDGGTTEPSRPSRRYGIEFSNYYTPTPWLTMDADVAFSRARFRDNDPVGNYIPEGIESVIAAGVTVHDTGGVFGSLRLRYFGPRALIEDDSFRSKATILLNGQVGYQITERWSLSMDVFNLLNRRDHDIDYAYESRITPTAPAQTEIHFHPVEPREVRFTLKARL